MNREELEKRVSTLYANVDPIKGLTPEQQEELIYLLMVVIQATISPELGGTLNSVMMRLKKEQEND